MAVSEVRSLSFKTCLEFWDEFEADYRKKGEESLKAAVRALCQNDLFYLLVRGCKRVDLLHPWLYERTREVEKDPDNHLDLWAREHYKSTIITFGLTISEILNDPNVTIGIFSHTRPIAKAFLRQIMRELQSNRLLHTTFPDILWGENVKEAPKWSEDDGIIVKRSANPNEATIEAWGVVDGQPTSKHFRILLYDDFVVADTVTTPEMISKSMTRLEESYNLGTTPGRRRMAGTRWHFNDPYTTVVQRGTFKLRFYPGTDDGTEDGEPIFWDDATMRKKRRDMGIHTFHAQILLNPKGDHLQGFRDEWIRKYRIQPPASGMNGYILVDPANEKKKESDYTVMLVFGLNRDKKRYLLDGVRDRLNLKERGDRLFALHRKWNDMGLKFQPVRYEKYGMMSDINYLRDRMEEENYRFKIQEVGGLTSKDDRIKRLVPVFEREEIWLPQSLLITNWEKTTVDLIQQFVEEEYKAFPVAAHKDMLDAMARLEEPDLPLVWPKPEKVVEPSSMRYTGNNRQTAWMS